MNSHITHRILILALGMALTAPQALHAAAAEPETAPSLPSTPYDNRLQRSEFISYTIRANATARNLDAEWNYLPLPPEAFRNEGDTLFTTVVTLPDFWADRIVILHTEGSRNSHIVELNGQRVGSSRDSGLPSEFQLRDATASSPNRITVKIPRDCNEPEAARSDSRPLLDGCYLYSQPRMRIVDYDVNAKVDGAGDGKLIVDAVVENASPRAETFSVCFDVFSPAGRVEEYGYRDVALTSGGRDTVRLTATIYGAGKHLWSASSPELYRLTLFVRQSKRILEYIPVDVGFGETSYSDGEVSRNGLPVRLTPAAPTATTPSALRKEIAALRKRGVNTLWPDTPQPEWFYQTCDREGMYVIDQVNLHTTHRNDDLRRGGSLANDPAWRPEFMERTRGTWIRTRNHPCIVAWSLGGECGNGYNLQKTYLWLKSADPARAVVYRHCGGEWNNDLPYLAE